MGSETAKRIGDAHEDNSNVNFEKRVFSNLSEADTTIDLMNNIIGRNIGNKNKKSSNIEIMKAVIKEYHTNGFQKAEKTKDGYQIIKSKLSTTRYNEAIKEINKLGENGKRNN